MKKTKRNLEVQKEKAIKFFDENGYLVLEGPRRSGKLLYCVKLSREILTKKLE